MVIMAHRAGGWHRFRTALPAVAGAAAGEVRDEQVRSGVRPLRAVAARAALGGVGAVIEPAFVEVAQGEGDRTDAEVERAGRRRLDLVAAVAGAVRREDGADRLLGAAGAAGELDPVAKVGRVARHAPRRRSQDGGASRAAAAV